MGPSKRSGLRACWLARVPWRCGRASPLARDRGVATGWAGLQLQPWTPRRTTTRKRRSSRRAGRGRRRGRWRWRGGGPDEGAEDWV